MICGTGKNKPHDLREHLPSLDFAGHCSQLKHCKKAQGVLGDVSSLHSCSYWPICTLVAQGEVAQLAGRSSHHSGRLESNGVIHPWDQN